MIEQPRMLLQGGLRKSSLDDVVKIVRQFCLGFGSEDDRPHAVLDLSA